MIDLDELERLCREATPGPWSLHVHTRDDGRILPGDDWTIYGPGKECVAFEGHPLPQEDANARLIPALRNAAPELIAMARRAAWVEANPDHHAMPYYLRGKWIVAGPLNAEGCGYRAFDTWAEAIDAAMQERK